MSATNSQLQLETYFLKELSYFLKDNLDTIPEPVAEISPVGLKIEDLTKLIDEQQRKWRCELTIKSSDAASGESFYKFKIVMVGFFTVNPALSAEQAKILAESNCPAVLYSTSREIIATVTRRSPYPAVLLPLVTFVKNIEEPKPKKRAVKKKSE
ncbi:MAG TPA: protein-export chaperone SecB [Pyrinomonadaceae bacterium]|jgi:preprotein translocase subunit SecB